MIEISLQPRRDAATFCVAGTGAHSVARCRKFRQTLALLARGKDNAEFRGGADDPFVILRACSCYVALQHDRPLPGKQRTFDRLLKSCLQLGAH